MCSTTAENKDDEGTRSRLKSIVGVLALANIGLVIAVIVLASNGSGGGGEVSAIGSESSGVPAPAPAPEVPLGVDYAEVDEDEPAESAAVEVEDQNEPSEEEEAPAEAEEAKPTEDLAEETGEEPAEEEEEKAPAEEGPAEEDATQEEEDDAEEEGPVKEEEEGAGGAGEEVAVQLSEEESAAVQEERNLAAFLRSRSASSFFDDPADNACAGKKLALDNDLCVDMEVQPQAGANITKGYVGDMDVGDIKPNTNEYYASKMCPVNVHWHLGAEHYSVGEFDEDGDGPHGNQPRPDWADRARVLAEGKEVRDGFRCHHYDENDEKFTKEYDWKYCEGMEVGETYEVHWPHSAAGACGQVNQYQTPFYDGVFCNLDMDTFSTLQKQDIANAVGVHGQVFTIVNDESYFYPDMMRGMIKDGEHGQDVAYYTGSTTGTTRDNEMCSLYTPITWQVDRKCHMISASSFDKMCYEMKMQRDDMSGDLHAHGARELVKSEYVANNQADRRLRARA